MSSLSHYTREQLEAMIIRLEDEVVTSDLEAEKAKQAAEEADKLLKYAIRSRLALQQELHAERTAKVDDNGVPLTVDAILAAAPSHKNEGGPDTAAA
jgi:hypothetical protein